MDALGDDVLILILSRLSLKEAGRTSVLSSRFTNLWRFSSKIDTVVDETIIASHDFRMQQPSSYIRRRTIEVAGASIQSLGIGVCELLRGRTVQNTLGLYPWLDCLVLWRVRGLGPILYLRSDTVSSLRLEELPRVQGIILHMPTLVSLSYAGRMASIWFHPNPPMELSTASVDFRRNVEEGGGIVARVPGPFLDLLHQFRHTRRRFTISTFFSGEMELELSGTTIRLGVTHLILEMTYSRAHGFDGVLSILRRCTDLHSLTIRLLDPAPFHVEVLFSADYLTRSEEEEGHPYDVPHISFEVVRVARHMFAQVTSFLERFPHLQTLTLSSYREDDREVRDSLFGWVDAWIAEGSFTAVVILVR